MEAFVSERAVISGDYVDIKFIKTRKVCVIYVELPIEAGAEFVAAFGTPNPAHGVPVAIARLTDKPAKKEERKGGDKARVAGILCNEARFRAFLNETFQYEVSNSDEAAEALREMCNIESRADLDHDKEAAEKFLRISAEYQAWLIT